MGGWDVCIMFRCFAENPPQTNVPFESFRIKLFNTLRFFFMKDNLLTVDTKDRIHIHALIELSSAFWQTLNYILVSN